MQTFYDVRTECNVTVDPNNRQFGEARWHSHAHPKRRGQVTVGRTMDELVQDASLPAFQQLPQGSEQRSRTMRIVSLLDDVNWDLSKREKNNTKTRFDETLFDDNLVQSIKDKNKLIGEEDGPCLLQFAITRTIGELHDLLGDLRQRMGRPNLVFQRNLSEESLALIRDFFKAPAVPSKEETDCYGTQLPGILGFKLHRNADGNSSVRAVYDYDVAEGRGPDPEFDVQYGRPDMGGERDPANNGGIANGHYICCGAPLGSPGCLIDMYSPNERGPKRYRILASVSSLTPLHALFIANDQVYAQRIIQIWTTDVKRGTAYINRDVYDAMHDRIVSLLTKTADPVARAYLDHRAQRNGGVIDLLSFYRYLGDNYCNDLIRISLLVHEYNRFICRGGERSMPRSAAEWIRYFDAVYFKPAPDRSYQLGLLDELDAMNAVPIEKESRMVFNKVVMDALETHVSIGTLGTLILNQPLAVPPVVVPIIVPQQPQQPPIVVVPPVVGPQPPQQPPVVVPPVVVPQQPPIVPPPVVVAAAVPFPFTQQEQQRIQAVLAKVPVLSADPIENQLSLMASIRRIYDDVLTFDNYFGTQYVPLLPTGAGDVALAYAITTYVWGMNTGTKLIDRLIRVRRVDEAIAILDRIEGLVGYQNIQQSIKMRVGTFRATLTPKVLTNVNNLVLDASFELFALTGNKGLFESSANSAKLSKISTRIDALVDPLLQGGKTFGQLTDLNDVLRLQQDVENAILALQQNNPNNNNNNSGVPGPQPKLNTPPPSPPLSPKTVPNTPPGPTIPSTPVGPPPTPSTPSDQGTTTSGEEPITPTSAPKLQQERVDLSALIPFKELLRQVGVKGGTLWDGDVFKYEEFNDTILRPMIAVLIGTVKVDNLTVYTAQDDMDLFPAGTDMYNAMFEPHTFKYVTQGQKRVLSDMCGLTQEGVLVTSWAATEDKPYPPLDTDERRQQLRIPRLAPGKDSVEIIGRAALRLGQFIPVAQEINVLAVIEDDKPFVVGSLIRSLQMVGVQSGQNNQASSPAVYYASTKSVTQEPKNKSSLVINHPIDDSTTITAEGLDSESLHLLNENIGSTVVSATDLNIVTDKIRRQAVGILGRIHDRLVNIRSFAFYVYVKDDGSNALIDSRINEKLLRPITYAYQDALIFLGEESIHASNGSKAAIIIASMQPRELAHLGLTTMISIVPLEAQRRMGLILTKRVGKRGDERYYIGRGVSTTASGGMSCRRHYVLL